MSLLRRKSKRQSPPLQTTADVYAPPSSTGDEETKTTADPADARRAKIREKEKPVGKDAKWELEYIVIGTVHKEDQSYVPANRFRPDDI